MMYRIEKKETAGVGVPLRMRCKKEDYKCFTVWM